jgi:hypothetical protein
MVLALLLCPAVNRVVRVQRLDQSTTYTPSFQRSLDVPPKPHVVLSDTQVVLLIVADLHSRAPSYASCDQRTIRCHRSSDPASPRSLRAPPATA